MSIKEETYRTPCYILHKGRFIKNCEEIETSFRTDWGENLVMGYSVKTNRCSELMQIAREMGWFAEVVSFAEYKHSCEEGYSAERIIANGPVKGEMLNAALGSVVYYNIDNLKEIEELSEKNIFDRIGNTQLGLRINFDLERECPGETSAGTQPIRFGICYENGDLKRAIDLLSGHGIMVDGLHAHFSTTTRSLNVYRAIAEKICNIAEEYNLNLRFIDVGGGFFGGRTLPGKPTMIEYSKTICGELKKHFDPSKVTLILEPGASIIATAVDYVSGVVNVRDICGERIVTLDGTSLHINPFMVKRTPSLETRPTGDVFEDVQHICGATCMEADRFCDIQLQRALREGDKVFFHNAGAYTMALNSEFILDKPNIYVTD